jgi:hypothetical protein
VAQQAKDTVKTEVISVTRSFTPKVQDAYKLDVNPQKENIVEKKIPVTYKIQSVPVASTFAPEKGRMANFNAGTSIEQSLPSYVSIAGGNYLNIESDAFIYYPVTDKFGSALRLSHYSSQGGETDKNIIYDPYYHTTADLLFDFSSGKSQWNLDLAYLSNIDRVKINPDIMSASISPISDENLNRKNNDFRFKIDGKFKDFFVKDAHLSFDSFWENFDNSEAKFKGLSKLSFPIGNFNLNMGIQADLVSGKVGKNKIGDIDTNAKNSYNNSDFGILPAVQIENDNLIFNLGAKIFYQNQDTLYKKLQLIPDVNINLNLIYEKLTVFAGVTGDIKQNSYVQHSVNNPYLLPENAMLPSLTPYDVFGGFNGAFSSAFSYEVKLGYRLIKNHPFYLQSESNYLYYTMIFDDMSQSYFETALNIGLGKKLDLKLHLDYMQNNPEHLKKAIMMPDYSFKSLLNFHPNDKIQFNIELNNIGSRTIDILAKKSIAGYTDLNLGIRYNVNKQFTAFIKGLNLLNESYEKYAGYPVQKIQILGGVSYRFDIPNN